MDSVESLLEQEGRLRSVFAEKSFMLMRRMRYGIGSCGGCKDGNVEVLAAQVGVVDWKVQKKKDEEVDGGES